MRKKIINFFRYRKYKHKEDKILSDRMTHGYSGTAPGKPFEEI